MRPRWTATASAAPCDSPFGPAALPEEVLFRGALLLLLVPLLGCSSRTTGAAAAAWLLILAGLHAPFGALNLAAAFIAGTGYTALTVASRSLWPAVLTHGYYNFVMLLLSR